MLVVGSHAQLGTRGPFVRVVIVVVLMGGRGCAIERGSLRGGGFGGPWGRVRGGAVGALDDGGFNYGNDIVMPLRCQGGGGVWGNGHLKAS